jgi:AcrR family transcriptional regulator
VTVTTETNGRAKRLPRAVREEQIVDAAIRVFSEHGYHAASMDEISEVAGISKPMIYAYLGHKEDLFTTCIQREATRLLEAVIMTADPGLARDVQLWRGLEAFFKFVGDNREAWRVLHKQAGALGGSFASEFEDIRKRAIALIAALLLGQGDESDTQAARRGDSLAAALMGAAESLADWWLDHPEESYQTLAARLMNLLWMGFGDLLDGTPWKAPA